MLVAVAGGSPFRQPKQACAHHGAQSAGERVQTRKSLVLEQDPTCRVACYLVASSSLVLATRRRIRLHAKRVRSLQRFNQLRRVRVSRSSTTDEDNGAVASLPSQDFSDPLAVALKAGPPLRLDPKGGLRVDFGAGGGVGSRVKWGLLKEEVSASEIDKSPIAEQKRAELRAAAARDLVNIDQDERERRRLGGLAFAALAVLLALFMLWSNTIWYGRAGLFPVVALAYGYLLSAEEGL